MFWVNSGIFYVCLLEFLLSKLPISVAYNWRRQWHPTPVLLPGKSHGRGAWWAAVHGVAKSRMRLSDFTFTFHFHALEKEMATHSSVLAWRIPGIGEPGGLPSLGSHRVWGRLKRLRSIAYNILRSWLFSYWFSQAFKNILILYLVLFTAHIFPNLLFSFYCG